MNSNVTADLVAADSFAREGHWAEALGALKGAYAKAPGDPEVHSRTGSYLLRLGYPPEQWLPFLEKAAAMSTSSAAIQMQLGLGYAVTRKPELASEAFRRALALDNCPTQASRLLALALIQTAHYEDARETLREVLRSHPDDWDICLLLGKTYELEGDFDSARFLYLKILETRADNSEAGASLRRISMREKSSKREKRSPDRSNPRSVVMLVEDRRIDRRVLDEARSLLEAGWEVTVIGGEPPDDNPYWDEECYPDLRIVRVNERMLSVPCFDGAFRYDVRCDRGTPDSARVNEHVKAILPDPLWRRFFVERRGYFMEALEHPAGVYVAHDLPQLPVALMAAMYHGSYVVYDSHELYPEQSFVRKSKEMLSAMETHLAPRADAVIVVNQSMTDEMKLRYGIDSEVILNCPSFDPRLLPVRRTNKLRESLGIPESMQILLYQGNIVSKIRNLENVIRAMTLIRRSDVALVLMGPDNGGGRDLVGLAAESQLLGRTVFFHPAVKQSELLGYTASADAGLIPYTPVDWNTKFCTPNKLYEFIVAGLPILANDLPELIRFVETLGIGANLPMGSAEEVAQAIDSFFAADRERFRRTLAEVSERFVWQNGEGRRIVGIYDGLTNTPPRLGARTPFAPAYAERET